MRYIRDSEIKPALAALKQLYYSMNLSSQYNPKSYEAKMLWRQIQVKQSELDSVNTIISSNNSSLYQYIAQKEEFYKSIRRHRSIQANTD